MMQTGVEIMMREDQPLVISSNWDSLGSSQIANQEAAHIGSLFLRSWISGFSSSSPWSHFLEITDLWNRLPTDASNSDGEDNQSCIKLATNPVMHKRSKHIDTKYHFTGEKVDDNSVQLVYTRFDQLSADLLTSTSESGATLKATIGSIADSSSRQRNNLSGGVEE